MGAKIAKKVAALPLGPRAVQFLGRGLPQTGWAQVLNQLMCDEPVRRRIERYL